MVAGLGCWLVKGFDGSMKYASDSLVVVLLILFSYLLFYWLLAERSGFLFGTQNKAVEPNGKHQSYEKRALGCIPGNNGWKPRMYHRNWWTSPGCCQQSYDIIYHLPGVWLGGIHGLGGQEVVGGEAGSGGGSWRGEWAAGSYSCSKENKWGKQTLNSQNKKHEEIIIDDTLAARRIFIMRAVSI